MKQKNPIMEKAGKTILLALTLTVAVYSCKKIGEKSTSSSTPGHTTGVTKSGDDDFYRNASNPYDYAGQQHNEGLDYIRTNILSWSLNWETGSRSVNDSLRALTIRYTSQNLHRSPDQVNEALKTLDEYKNVNLDSTAFLQLIASSEMSDPAKAYMVSLTRAVKNYSDYTQLDIKITAIKKIEDKVLADGHLTTDERMQILGGAAIARHSAYWWNQHPDPWPASVSPEGFPWVAAGCGAFSDFLAFQIAYRGYEYPLADSIAVGLLGSALGLGYLAYEGFI